jgi:hypothetical protein
MYWNSSLINGARSEKIVSKEKNYYCCLAGLSHYIMCMHVQLTILFVCKAHYYNCILNELVINSTFGNPTYTPTALSKDEILQNHRSVLDISNIPANGMNEF